MSYTPFRSAKTAPSFSGIHVPLSESISRFLVYPERDAGHYIALTLILSISTLHLFMDSLLDVSFQDPRPGWFVIVAHFQDMGSVDVIVAAPAHDRGAFGIEFKYGYL